MPKTSAKKLAYQAKYNSQPDRAAIGVEQRRARRHAIAKGEVSIGDGKDLAHKRAADNGGRATEQNLVVKAAGANRGWRKASGYKVPNTK